MHRIINKMKTLVVYYSRTGVTKKVGKAIARLLKCDFEEIIDTKNRAGPIGFIISGKDAGRRNLTKIKPIKKDPSKYGLVIIGTPVWVYNMAPAIRTYINQNKKKFKKVAFFCTLGSSGDDKAFKEMQKLSKKPAATLSLKTKEVKKGDYIFKVEKFVKSVK